jgi:hypothetical protein
MPLSSRNTSEPIGRNALVAAVTPETVASLLPNAGATELRIVRCIVLHNILSKRVGGLIRSGRIPCAGGWAGAYVPRVAGFFRAERANWIALLGPQREQLFERVRRMCRLRANTLRQHHPGADIDLDDLALETYDQLIGAGRLRNYPFDEPLDAWVGRVVAHSAKRLYGFEHVVAEIEIDCDDEAQLPRQLVVDDSAGPIRAAFRLGVDALAPLDLRILHLLARGERVERIAATLGKGQATIYRRRSAILRQLRGALT